MANNIQIPIFKTNKVNLNFDSKPASTKIIDLNLKTISNFNQQYDEIDYNDEKFNIDDYKNYRLNNNQQRIAAANNLFNIYGNFIKFLPRIQENVEIPLLGRIIKIQEESTLLIEYDGSAVYRYNKDGLCEFISYGSGLDCEILYDSNGNAIDITFFYSFIIDGEKVRGPIQFYDSINDDQNNYGGNQNEFRFNTSELMKDPIIKKILEEDYPGFTEEEYELYLNQVADYGCGYTALANTVFKEFEGREMEFEKIFGYPMYTVSNDGDLNFNYEYLILELFNYGNKSKLSRADSVEEFLDWGCIGVEKQEYWLFEGENGDPVYEEAKNSFNGLKKYIEKKCSIEINHKEYSCEEFGIEDKNGNIVCSGEKLINKIKKEIDKGNQVIFAAQDFDIYSPYQSKEILYEDIPMHGMYVVEVVDEGIIISNWGKRHLIPIEELNGLDEFTSIDVFEYKN